MKKITKIMTEIILIFVLVIGVLPNCNVRAASLSAVEKKYYKDVLKNEKFSSPLYGAEFLLYDVNGDGRKDLIVYGDVGAYHSCELNIFTYDGKKFHTASEEGSVIGVSKKGVLVDTSNYYYGYDPEYNGDFDMEYDSAYVAKISSKGKITRVLSKDITKRYTLDDPRKLFNKTSQYMQISGSKVKKITKAQYEKMVSKYKFRKSIKAHKLTKANIDKYVR